MMDAVYEQSVKKLIICQLSLDFSSFLPWFFLHQKWVNERLYSCKFSALAFVFSSCCSVCAANCCQLFRNMKVRTNEYHKWTQEIGAILSEGSIVSSSAREHQKEFLFFRVSVTLCSFPFFQLSAQINLLKGWYVSGHKLSFAASIHTLCEEVAVCKPFFSLSHLMNYAHFVASTSGRFFLGKLACEKIRLKFKDTCHWRRQQAAGRMKWSRGAGRSLVTPALNKQPSISCQPSPPPTFSPCTKGGRVTRFDCTVSLSWGWPW